MERPTSMNNFDSVAASPSLLRTTLRLEREKRVSLSAQGRGRECFADDPMKVEPNTSADSWLTIFEPRLEGISDGAVSTVRQIVPRELLNTIYLDLVCKLSNLGLVSVRRAAALLSVASL